MLVGTLALVVSPLLMEDQCHLVSNSTGYSIGIQSPHQATVGQPVGYFVSSFPPGAGNLLMVTTSYTRWRYRPFFSRSDLCVGPVFRRHNLHQPLGTMFVGFWDPGSYQAGDRVFVQWVHTDWVVPVIVWNTSRVVEIEFVP